jgi:hypothetical protein
MRRSVAVVLVVAAAAVTAVAVLPAMAAQRVTQTPTFQHRAHSLAPGHAVHIRVGTHSEWPKGQRCALSLTGPGYRSRTWTARGVVADLLVTFIAPRHVRSGGWRLSARCRFPGVGWSRGASTLIRVHGRRGGAQPLVGARGPMLDALSPGGSAIIGFGGAGIPPDPFQNGECTYYAYEKRPDIYLQSVNGGGAPPNGWNAWNWALYAAKYGHFQEGSTPAVGALMAEPPSKSSSVGHVAYVTAVTDSTHWVTQEMNTDAKVRPNKVFTVYNDTGPGSGYYYVGGQLHRHVVPGTVFIYGGPVLNPPQYAGELGHIVQWAGDTKAQKTAWLVVNEGGQLHRHWIASIAAYWCLKNSGAPGPDVLPAAELNQLPDDTGVQATCTGNSAPPGGGSGGSPPPTAPATYSELEGHNGTNTFSNPANASGQGQRIGPGQTVQVSCKVYDPQIASVNPDGYWYLIATAPWSGAYYAPANTFMNGDPWNGPYTHNTDASVPDCGGSSTPPPTTTTTTTTTPPPAQTWAEAVGGVTHTWTNYTNAGGTAGPSIQTGQTVQVACAVQGFQVADGDTWWYRIASAPWSGAYYASADAFYNNGQTTGTLKGTPLVDPAVSQC